MSEVNELIIKIEGIGKVYKNGTVALNDFNLEIEKGQIVGFIGPNGAGKTTLLKILSGILQPTSGSANVLGFTPIDRKNAFLKKISFLTGTKSQLNADLPALDSFDLKRIVYEIPKSEYEAMLAKYIKQLDVEEIVKRPVRTLSLGQRMRCELLHAFLHKPEVLFLDEPTLGLDASSQEAVRSIIKNLVADFGSTIILTSHYMEDIEQLAQKLVVINEGKKLFDGTVSELRQKYAPGKKLSITFNENIESDIAKWLAKNNMPECVVTGNRGVISVKRETLPAIVEYLSNNDAIADFDIVDESITELIKQL